MDVVILAILSAVVLVVGLGVGMLLAPRIGRWADRDDEERRDDGSG
jgi:hypothetical protein